MQAERNSRPLPWPGSDPACLMDVVPECGRVQVHVASDSRAGLTHTPTCPQLIYLRLRVRTLAPPVLASLQRHLLSADQPCLRYMRCCVDPLSRPACRAILGPRTVIVARQARTL